MTDRNAVDDLSALAWVHEELRRSLDAAHKALRRFVKEAEALASSDIDAVDPAVLRARPGADPPGRGCARTGRPAGRGAGAARQRSRGAALHVRKPHKLTRAVGRRHRARLVRAARLPEPHAGRQAGLPPLSLFPQYRAVQEAGRCRPGASGRPVVASTGSGASWPGCPGRAASTPTPPRAPAIEAQLLAMMRALRPRGRRSA